MPRARITSKGQITIPRSVRQALRVGEGDYLDFVMDAAGGALVKPAVRNVTVLKGLLHRAGRKAVSVEQMNAAIARQGRRR